MNVICIDLDGVICSYKNGFQGVGEFGELIPGAKEMITKLYNECWYIVIYTGRDELQAIENFLMYNGIPFNEVQHKRRADVYLDDRGINFNGNWEEAFEKVKNFKPWEQEDEDIPLENRVSQEAMATSRILVKPDGLKEVVQVRENE